MKMCFFWLGTYSYAETTEYNYQQLNTVCTQL